MRHSGLALFARNAAMVVTAFVAVASVVGMRLDPPTHEDYSNVAKKNVATLPVGVLAEAEASIVKETRNVTGGLNPGSRPVYRWNSPERLKSAVWEGNWAGNVLAPGRVERTDASPDAGFYGEYIPQGYRGNLALLPAWVPPTLFSRADTLGESSEPLIPAAMYKAPTGWQGRKREILNNTVDLMTGTPLIQVTDLKLPVGGATFQLTRTRSALHGTTFPTIGSDNSNKFAYDATDRVWDWLGAGWMVGENPILLIDDTRADVVGDNPPTCWLILDAHRSIPFQWVDGINRYEAPPRFRARLTYTVTADSGEVREVQLPDHVAGDRVWITPPTEIKISLYDDALVYTFAVIWEDVPKNTWRTGYLSETNSNEWGESSLHDRPFLPERFDASREHTPWDRSINRGLGIPYYALLTEIKDRNGVRVEINYTPFRQYSIDSPHSDVQEVMQEGHKKGQISYIQVYENDTQDVAWTLVYSHRTFLGVRRPYMGPDGQYFYSEEDDSNGDPISEWFFDHGARREYPWDVDNEAARDRASIHGYSAIDRIYVYKGDSVDEGVFEQLRLQSSPWDGEMIEDADSIAALNAPIERQNLGASEAELLNWSYAIRYDYHRGVPETIAYNESIRDAYTAFEGWWVKLRFGEANGFDPAVDPASAPTSPPMLLLTTVFERKGDTAPVPFKRRGIIYDEDPDYLYPFSETRLHNPYRINYSGGGGGSGAPGGMPMLPWIEAILENADIARLSRYLRPEVPEDEPQPDLPAMHDVLLNYRDRDGVIEPIPFEVRDHALNCASIRFDQAKMAIPATGAGSNSAPSLAALWTTPSSSEHPGPYIRTGSSSGQGDQRAYWDGHWATVGAISSGDDASNAQFHARVHRFIRRPMEIENSENERSHFAFPGQTHMVDSAPMASVFLSPFQWHSYTGVDALGGGYDALVAPPDGLALAEPRVIVVVDEFASREKMLADVNYSTGDEGALKEGMVARTVYELNPWGYLLRKRRWEFNDGGFQVQTEGIGEEYIYSTVAQIAAANNQVLPTAEHLAPPPGFVDELLLSEHRSLGWSVADQQSPGGGASEGLVQFYEYSLAVTSNEGELERFGWSDRVQMTSMGVKKGNGSSSPRFYTHQYFYGNTNIPNVPTALVRFNQASTSLLASAPQLPSPGQVAPNPAYSVEYLVDQYPNETVSVGEVPSMRTRISPPLQQRPGGDWYFPIEIECKDSLGQPTWTGSGLVRDPLDPGSGGPEFFETLTWTYHESGAFGLPRAVVVDVDPPALSDGHPILYDQPELGSSQSITVSTFVQRWVGVDPNEPHLFDLPPRIANEYSGPPLERLTVYGYDGEGNLTDIIEPERRWARRVVTDLGTPNSNGENLDPLDDRTYEYTFAGLTSYESPASGTDSGTYQCLDGGTIGIHYGNNISGQPTETLHVRYPNTYRVPIVLTAANRPQGAVPPGLGDYEELRRTEYKLDGSGRPTEAANMVWVNGFLVPENGREINDLGEVYRVSDSTGNVNRWTRNYLGMRFRRYEGTLDTYWGNEEYQVLGNGTTDHDFDQDHGVDFTGYDMVLKELFIFGQSPRDIRQPIEHLRFLSDDRGSWAHVRESNSTAGYHNPPSPTHLANAEDDAYLTVFEYDWSMRRVREDIYDLPAVGTQLQDSDCHRTILHYYDYAGREAMTVVFGPLIPSDISTIDPTLLGPDAVLPSVDAFLALNPRPLSITTRVFDNADRVVEAREYDVASPIGQGARFTRSLAYHGFKDQQVFTLDSGAPAVATYVDALGRPVVITELTTNPTGEWSVELSRENLTLNDRGQVVSQVSWERVNSTGDTLDSTNAVPTTTWNWYDHSGRITATAELGTGDASYLAPSQLPTGYDDVDAPQLTSPGLVVTIDSELAGARVTIHAYNEVGRIIATRHPDGTIDTFAYDRARPLATTYNANATSSDLSRTTAQGRTEGKVTSIRAIDTLANIDTPLPGAHGWMSQQFGAPVLDRDFEIQSFDRTRPARMGRTFDVDPDNPVAASSFEFEFAYDFLGRLAQRIALDGTVTRYTYDVFDELRTVEIGRLVAGEFTPGYPATSGIAAADRIGFIEFASTWSVGENKEPIEVRDVIARVAREDPAGGPGRVVSHVQQHFDGRGNLVREFQAIGTMVNADTPCIEYEWAFVTAISSLDTGFSRLSAIKYPDFFASGRRTVSIDYGSPGTITDNFNLAFVVKTKVDAGPEYDVLKCGYVSTARRSSSHAKSLRIDMHSGAGTAVGFDRVDSFGDLAITAYESIDAYGQATPVYSAHYHRDALARVVAVETSYHNSFNNTRSSGHRYDPLGRLTESAIGTLSYSPGDPANWSMTSPYRADAWHMDRLDNWNRADPNNSALFGHVTVGNLDADPATETAFFHYDTTASSDLELLKHGLDGTVDPPVLVKRDPLGRVLFDGIYFYGYDAWGRLTQINLAEDIGSGQYQQGELVRHFVYDGLGRTIRVQRAAEGVMDDPGVDYVSSEFIFYDGMRRIADVLAAPVYDKYSALVTGGESGENQNEAGQEAGLFVDGKTANTGFEHLELGGETYLQVHREYVWDPDPDYSPFGGVDTLIAYFDGADRDKPWFVIQSQQGDPVAIVDCDATTHVATIVWRAAFEPYGSVVWSSNASADPSPRLAMGHKGLFVERLDAPPVVWFFNDDERLAPEADLLVLMRNRQYLPRLGRFLQPDPNATGVAVQPDLGFGGSALSVPAPFASLHGWAINGTNALVYVGSDPINQSDPQGLFFGGIADLAMTGLDLYDSYSDVFDQMHQGFTIGLGLFDQINHHFAMQAVDAEWAGNWDWSDDWLSPDRYDDNSDDVANHSGPAVAAAWMDWTKRKHGGRAHDRAMRNVISELMKRYREFGYKTPQQMRQNIRFNQQLSVDGESASRMRPDIQVAYAPEEGKSARIHVIEIEHSHKSSADRRVMMEDALNAKGAKLQGYMDLKSKNAVKHIQDLPSGHFGGTRGGGNIPGTKIERPSTKVRPGRRGR